jgi:predicted nucleic acid-binding protein
MPILLWDASALAKRYAPEMGSDTVDALFAAVPSADTVSSSISYAELCSILLRKLNRGAIDKASFDAAKSALRMELIVDPDFVLLSVGDAAFYDGITLMEAHNLNATDSALLSLFKGYVGANDSIDKHIIIAADDRLARAAQAEGLRALNPERVLPGDLPRILAAP